MTNEEMMAEIAKLQQENRQLKGIKNQARRCGPLTTIEKTTQWKAASAKTLAELMVAGKLQQSHLNSIGRVSPEKLEEAQLLASKMKE